MFFSKSRTYHDPIHGAITLNGGDRTESLLIQLIDTPEFQRLRRIRQLDIAAFTFHGAEGSRFTHALGVMALTRRAFDAIALEYPYLAMHRPVALVAPPCSMISVMVPIAMLRKKYFIVSTKYGR